MLCLGHNIELFLLLPMFQLMVLFRNEEINKSDTFWSKYGIIAPGGAELIFFLEFHQSPAATKYFSRLSPLVPHSVRF